MRKFVFLLILATATTVAVWSVRFKNQTTTSGAPPYGEPEENAPEYASIEWLKYWKRPDGPAKVALQVGHWKNADFPDELAKLRGNTGAEGGGKYEWEVNLAIAQEVQKVLSAKDIQVEILSATVPPAYWADVFVAIHADGSTDLQKRGFKVASPWRDFTHRANLLVTDIKESYQQATGYDKDPNITRNMRGYYAFSWWRYDHAIHPMTTAAIVETGFLTNYQDRKLLVDNPHIPAAGIANGIITYLDSQQLIN